jgi:hypothetical protein
MTARLVTRDLGENPKAIVENRGRAKHRTYHLAPDLRYPYPHIAKRKANAQSQSKPSA